jgi:NADPH:quinone reductase-like Zn-dependent oxidoreductase
MVWVFQIHSKVARHLVKGNRSSYLEDPAPSDLQVIALYRMETNSIAIRFLHLSGFSTIITTASKTHESLVRKFGATHVIDRTLPIDDQVAEIKSIAPALQHAWDAIGSKETNELVARSFGSQGGQIVASLPVDQDVLAEHKNVSGKGIYGAPVNNHVESATKIWSHIEEALRKGDVLPIPHKVWGGLATTADALQAVKKASGYKVIVHPQE